MSTVNIQNNRRVLSQIYGNAKKGIKLTEQDYANFIMALVEELKRHGINVLEE